NPAEGETTPLMEAAKEGQTPVVKYLLSQKAQVEASDRVSHETALWVAKNYDCVKALLEAKADVNTANVDGETVLMHWLEQGDRDSERVIRLLISKGADVNCMAEAGETGLMRAVGAGNAAIVRLLLEKSARVDGQDDAGETA